MATVTSDEVELLVRAAAAGDEGSWNALVEEFAGLVWSVARSFRLDDATVADVVQEAWTRLAQNLDRIHDKSRVSAWLITTTKREALRVIRVAGREWPSEFDDEREISTAPDPGERLLAEERHERLYTAMMRLSDEQQQLLRLLLVEPKIPYEDIAELMNRPVGWIGPTRGRCLEKLRRILEQEGMGS